MRKNDEAAPILSAEELADLGCRAFGPGWQSALGRDRGVAIRTVQRWASDGIAKPATAKAIRAYLQSRTVVSVPAPPASGDRSSILEKAMGSVVADIAQAGEAVGWSEAETRTALRKVLYPRHTGVRRLEPRHVKPFTYDPAIDPCLITGHGWKVGADFNFVTIRTGDGSLRSTPLADTERTRAIDEIMERADEIAAHGLQSAAYVIGFLMLEGGTDSVDTVGRIYDVLNRAHSDEERQELQAVMEGRPRSAG